MAFETDSQAGNNSVMLGKWFPWRATPLQTPRGKKAAEPLKNGDLGLKRWLSA